MWRFVPVVCFKVVWLRKGWVMEAHRLFIGGFGLTTTIKNRLYNYNSVMSPEYESRKCELKPVTEEEIKTGKRIKSRIFETNVTKDRLTT